MADDPAAPTGPSQRTPLSIMARLSAMMFLQYWPLGIWGVTVGTYIAANTGSAGTGIFSAGFVGYSTAAGAIGSLLSPVLFGFLSDRYFAAERLLALMHAGCAIAAWGMYESNSQWAFFIWLFAYYQCFSPAAALTNKIALKHLAKPDRDYPFVRIFSTVGWISTGLFLSFIWPSVTGDSIEATRTPLLLGAIASALMAAYSVTLPATPPAGRSGDFIIRALQDSRQLLTNGPLLLFLAVAALACVPSMAYNNYGNLFLNNQGYPRPAALMTIGQLSDVMFLAAMPWLIARFGLRALFAGGILAWNTRYILLALGAQYNVGVPVYAAIAIHGACYVFVYVGGVMYVDHLVSSSLRGVAQGVYALATSGVGHLLGALTVGLAQETYLTPRNVSPAPYEWPQFWAVPAAISLFTLVLFFAVGKGLRPTGGVGSGDAKLR